MDITKEMQDAYMHSEYAKCPCCGSLDVQTEGFTDDDVTGIYRIMYCDDCRAQWYEHYKLTHISNLKPGEEQQITADAILSLAKTFSIILTAMLDGHMPEVLRRNETMPDGGCASHDFCDANMAMDAAFKIVLGRSAWSNGVESPLSDNDLTWWNMAWNMAKTFNFYYDAKKD